MTVIEQEKTTLPTVLITGCSDGGIGSALAETFHDRGYQVFATARTLKKMSNLAKLPNATLLELDVESQPSIDAALKAVIEKTGGEGRLDVLVNNSGLNLNYPALDTDLTYAKKMFDVNFWGVVYLTHAFMPMIIASKGVIVNNASVAGVLHAPWGAFYGASKAAVRMYGETLRVELAPMGVRVVTIMTGIVGSKIFENSPNETLPETSYYSMASKDIAEIARGEKYLPIAMPLDTYAKSVVNDIIGGSNGMIWRGKFASVMGFMGAYFPAWLTESILVSSSGLGNLKKV